MKAKDLIEKLKQYPEDADLVFYYSDGHHAVEAIFDPTFNHLPNANYLEITIS